MNFRKLLAVLMTLCMFLGMTDITVSAEEGSEFQESNEEFVSVNLMSMGNPIDSGIIYVGGTPSESPDGSSDAPFLTIKQAADAINADADGGSYQIILQGNTTESEAVTFGNGTAAVYDITITNSATGGAVQATKAFDEGNLITLYSGVTLTLQGCSDTQELIFDGGGIIYNTIDIYSLFHITIGATLNLNAHTVVQNNISEDHGYGRGITNIGGTLVVNGGTIRNNTEAILNWCGEFTLSGNAYIPESLYRFADIGERPVNWINLYESPIRLSSALQLSNDNRMVIRLCGFPSVNDTVLSGDLDVIYNNYEHFRLADSQYVISYLGKVAAFRAFYVDKDYGGGDSDGSLGNPFTNLSDAVSGIDGVGIIYIRSDLEMMSPINISADQDITILNYSGTTPTITYTGTECMFFVNRGVLRLGSKESGNDDNPSLIFRCNNEEDYFIYNKSRLNLYPGVKLEGDYNSDPYAHFYSIHAAIYNDEKFNMYGGIITGNSGHYTGGVENQDTFVMEGGIISNCDGMFGTGGVYNDEGASFTMNGGRIECTKGSIGNLGTLHISGDASIPAGSYDSTIDNDITAFSNSSIIIDSNLSSADQIGLIAPDSFPGMQILNGTNDILLNNYQKFRYDDSVYVINSLGKLVIPLREEMVSRKNEDELYYTGSEVKPTFDVKHDYVSYNYVHLTEGTDYKVSYSNNINVGTAAAVLEGLGNYTGSVSIPFTINKAVVQSIGTPAPPDKTFSASEGMTLDKLRALIPLNTVTVNINLGTASLPITWAVSGGAYSPKGGTYTFTGSLTGNDNIDTNGKTLLAKITVTPVTLDKPVFGAISVTEGTNGKATAVDLGTSVLPTVGTVVTAGTAVHYTITWDDSTLDMTIPGAINIFTGTIAYTDAPDWATLPTNLNATREVSVTAKPAPTPTPTTPVIPPYNPDATITPTPSDIPDPEVTPELTPTPSLSEVYIEVTVPDSITGNDDTEGDQIQLDADIIEEAKEKGKDVRVSVKDEEGKERYSWSFAGDDLAASDNEVTNLDLSLRVEKAKDNKEISDLLGLDSQADDDNIGSNSLVLSFGYHGKLPAQASIRIYVGDMGYSEGDRVYLYYYNPDTGMLDTLPYSSDYTVDSEGYITINITHCSEYVLLPQKAPADMITALRDQISVTPDKTVLYTGTKAYSTAVISIKLPDTLELISDLKDKTSGSAVGAVTVTYKSSNPKVAAVDSSGRITARGIGKTTINVTAVLYSGKSRTFKIPVTVMKPYITITVSTGTMNVGDNFTFTAQAYGLDIGDIVWTTTKKSIVIIDKKTGKAKAVMKGCDYVVASIGNITCNVKVTVK